MWFGRGIFWVLVGIGLVLSHRPGNPTGKFTQLELINVNYCELAKHQKKTICWCLLFMLAIDAFFFFLNFAFENLYGLCRFAFWLKRQTLPREWWVFLDKWFRWSILVASNVVVELLSKIQSFLLNFFCTWYLCVKVLSH